MDHQPDDANRSTLFFRLWTLDPRLLTFLVPTTPGYARYVAKTVMWRPIQNHVGNKEELAIPKESDAT